MLSIKISIPYIVSKTGKVNGNGTIIDLNAEFLEEIEIEVSIPINKSEIEEKVKVFLGNLNYYLLVKNLGLIVKVEVHGDPIPHSISVVTEDGYIIQAISTIPKEEFERYWYLAFYDDYNKAEKAYSLFSKAGLKVLMFETGNGYIVATEISDIEYQALKDVPAPIESYVGEERLRECFSIHRLIKTNMEMVRNHEEN